LATDTASELFPMTKKDSTEGLARKKGPKSSGGVRSTLETQLLRMWRGKSKRRQHGISLGGGKEMDLTKRSEAE